MRNRLIIGAAALVLASASLARAQQPQTSPSQTQATDTDTAPSLGSVDFGFRGSSIDGDEARYQRYRDLRDGAFSQIVFGKATETYLFDASAENIGYHDQRYVVRYNGGKLKFSGTWDSIPLNYSYETSTPWVESSPGVFTLDVAARTRVQNKAPGVVGVPQSAAQLQSASIYRGLASPFDLQSRRDVAEAGLTYNATKEVSLSLTIRSTNRTGNQPWGASFAFNNANELPLPVDNRTNDFSAAIEYANQKGMVRAAWDGSWFDNKIHDLVWDNPLRATDTNPYDPSGYSNGNGPAQGRMSLAPDNNMNAFSATGLYKMPMHSTVNGTVAFTTMEQNDTLIPWTINPVIANASVYRTFPGLAALPRNTAEAKVDGVNALFNFTTRPTRNFGLTARYRYNDHQNKTPAFDAVEYVRFDAVPEETGSETEQFDITENTFDVNATYNLMSYSSIRVGYTYDDFKRTGRAFNNMTDNTVRASIDTIGNRYVTVRGIYEFTGRKGSGFSEDAIEEGGAQPGLRFYDEADRDRNRGTLLFIANPVDIVDLTFSVAAGKDTYKGAGHEFGLLNNDNTSVNVGVNVNPMPRVAFGANYGYDKYSSLQKSRNANPPPDPSFNDPNRDWTVNNDEKVNNFNAYLDLRKAIQKTDIRLNYDYSDSDNGFTYGGPRIPALAAIGQFIPLPNVTNKWQRLSADVKYFVTTRVGVGVGYWYEKLDIVDFATIDLPGQPGTPRIDYLGEISTGYGNRPYKGQTGFLRILYLF